MKKMNLTKEERRLAAEGLTALANWVETGQIHLSQVDCHQMKKPFNALDENQMDRVARLRALARRMK